jgi:hypothetical protein
VEWRAEAFGTVIYYFRRDGRSVLSGLYKANSANLVLLSIREMTRSNTTKDNVRKQCATARKTDERDMNAQDCTLQNATGADFVSDEVFAEHNSRVCDRSDLRELEDRVNR